MNQAKLNDGSGRWIDLDRALVLDESIVDYGKGKVSAATGWPDQHQQLIISANGFTAIRCWQDGGKWDYVEACDADAGAQWCKTCGYDPATVLPTSDAGKEV